MTTSKRNFFVMNTFCWWFKTHIISVNIRFAFCYSSTIILLNVLCKSCLFQANSMKNATKTDGHIFRGFGFAHWKHIRPQCERTWVRFPPKKAILEVLVFLHYYNEAYSFKITIGTYDIQCLLNQIGKQFKVTTFQLLHLSYIFFRCSFTSSFKV